MSYKRKEQKLKNIANIYLRSIFIHIYRSQSTNYQRVNSFQSAVELAYASLTAPLKQIINNDFFYQNYPGWWKSKYNKISYIKMRMTAINKFLEVFYEI